MNLNCIFLISPYSVWGRGESCLMHSRPRDKGGCLHTWVPLPESCVRTLWGTCFVRGLIFIMWIMVFFMIRRSRQSFLLAPFTQQVFPEDQLSREQNQVQDSLRVGRRYWVLPSSMSKARTRTNLRPSEACIESYVVLRLSLPS